MRLGLRSEAVLEHIRWLNTRFLDVLQNGLAEGIALVPLAVTGLAGGDDCHGRTVVATDSLVTELKDRTPGGLSDDNALEFMATSPSLFLNLWMAATKCLLKVAEGVGGVELHHSRRRQRARGRHSSLGPARRMVHRTCRGANRGVGR